MSYDQGMWRANAQSREMWTMIGEKRAGDETCACGKFKPAPCLVCKSCWFSVPAELRKSYFSRSIKERRAAVRTILDQARARNPESNPSKPTKVTII